ncbi:MarR family winged helix-turn-helix transcriptional regulator [Leucobacter sp. W1153]|uniref:MarR family winged helix-turn-helix transcriptional regulator n=1 Tax=Leucobacter sp. W1153 TaxID=3439064 RepID=UPI003F3D7273
MFGDASGPAALAVEAWEALFRAQSILFRKFTETPIWHGRTTREYDILYQLGRDGERGMRQRDLTERLFIPQPSLSRMIERLVTEGLIDRSPDPRDGRGAILMLSETGRALQRRIGAGHASDIAQTMRDRLSEDELRTLKHLAEKLAPPAGLDHAESAAGAESEVQS